jgi:predicted RNase H-like HicB family nuclease
LCRAQIALISRTTDVKKFITTVVVETANNCLAIMKLGATRMSYKVSIVIEKDEDGYYAYCPGLEGCQTQGDSVEEATANIQEAVELYLETLSNEEKKALLSKEISTMTLEVQVA